MKIKSLITVAVFILIAGCGDPGPTLSVENVQVIASAPGRTASVAYMAIHNNTGDRVAIHGISSPQFASAEFHETMLIDGMAAMVELNTVSINANSTLVFEAGAKHIMLLEPTTGLLPGKPVSLQIDFGEDEMLIIESPLSTRGPLTDVH